MKTATHKLRSPLKWHGGKSYLARRIIALMPEHRVYVEPFAGGGSVLLNKASSEIEVINDIDPKLALFWSVIADEGGDHYFRFWDFLRTFIYAQEEFDRARTAVDHAPPNPWEFDAIGWGEFAGFYMARNRMSRGGLGKDFAWSDRLRGGQPGDVNAWETAVEAIPLVRKRLHREAVPVKVCCGSAIDVIRRYDGLDSLHYCDPPYLHETRTAKAAYAHEMGRDDHVALLMCLLDCRGAVILSGYRNPMYDDLLSGWTRHDFDMPNHSGQGKAKQRRTECLWLNPRATEDRP